MTTESTEAVATTGEHHLELQKRQAALLAQSQFLPKHYAGKPADCLVAIQWAQRTGLDPLELLQNTFVVHGTPGMKASYMIAQANMRGPFDGPIRFRVEGTGDEMVAYAFGMIDGEKYEASASMKMAKAEGWTKNKKYQTMPELMLSYRAAAFLVRLYCPEVLCGMPTSDEVEDIHYAEARVVEPQREAVAEVDALLRGEEPDSHADRKSNCGSAAETVATPPQAGDESVQETEPQGPESEPIEVEGTVVEPDLKGYEQNPFAGWTDSAQQEDPA